MEQREQFHHMPLLACRLRGMRISDTNKLTVRQYIMI
jgi:hypothetical protein